MSPVGQLSAHSALKPIIGAAKPAKPPGPAPASDWVYAKQQTCPPAQCEGLEHESEDPAHEPTGVQDVVGPPPKAPNPPRPGGPASPAGAGA
jgi:hypothetical protein